MIPEPGDASRDITVTETFPLQTDDELSDKELKQVEADDQAIQTILLGLPEDIYVAVDSCETAQEIWLRPEYSRHVTIVHQTKDLHTADYTQLYDFLKYNQKERISSNPRNKQIGQPGMNIGQDRQMQIVGSNSGNQFRQYVGQNARNPTRPRRRDAAYLQIQLLIAQKEEAGIQLQAKEYDLMAAAADLDEIEEVNANCILMANLQQASTSGGETVEQHPANFEETRALYESLYQNLAIEVEKVNSVNRKLKETNADMTTELARYKNQERCFEISQEKYNKLE
nr:hypothetical protein [Tanacetum cinerariifolium]